MALIRMRKVLRAADLFMDLNEAERKEFLFILELRDNAESKREEGRDP